MVGREILRNNLKEAVFIYLTKEGDEENEAKSFRKNLSKSRDFGLALRDCPKHLKNEIILLEHLARKPNDYAGALRRIPKKFRRMFIHAYQSYLWNNAAKVSAEERIPLIGFGTDLTKYKTGKQIEKVLKKEGISKSDFHPESMPELASEGSERERVVKPEGLEWKFGEDEVNENRLKCTLKFELPKGSYATVLIDEVLK